MTTGEWINAIEAYFGPWERAAIKGVVAGVIDDLHPEVRVVLCRELMRTMETRWKHTPDWADIDKTLQQSEAVRRVRMEIRSDRQQALLAQQRHETAEDRGAQDEVEVPTNWMETVRELAARRKA